MECNLSVSISLPKDTTKEMNLSSANLDLEDLYHRAVADPQSITRAERNAIFGQPPPEEEDRLCVAMTGHTIAQLQAKALSNPDGLALTRDEALILHHTRGVNFQAYENVTKQQRWERLLCHSQRHNNCSPLELLLDEAQRRLNSVRGEEEKAAVLIAMKRQQAIDDAELEVSRRRWQEHDRAYRLQHGTGWIRVMLRNGLLADGVECWGFVVFRTGCYGSEEGEAAWRRFRDHFDKVAQTSVLHYNSGPELWPTFRTVFVDDDEALEGASDELLCARFRGMRDGDGGKHLPKGIRTSCFLVADRAVIESEAATTAYVPRYSDDIEASVHILEEDPVVYIRAVNPDFEARAGAAEEKAKKREKDEVSGNGVGDGVRTSGTGPPAATAEGKNNAERFHNEMASFHGQATVALPRVFDWLHFVCFSAERGFDIPSSEGREGWHAIHVQTKTPEAWMRNWAANSGGLRYSEERRLQEAGTQGSTII
jgi:hypothetical protein